MVHPRRDSSRSGKFLRSLRFSASLRSVGREDDNLEGFHVFVAFGQNVSQFGSAFGRGRPPVAQCPIIHHTARTPPARTDPPKSVQQKNKMPTAAPSRSETFPLLKKKQEQKNGGKQQSLSAADNPNHCWLDEDETLVATTKTNTAAAASSKQHRVLLPITPAYRQRRYEARKHWFGCSLAALSAFADVLCYHSFGCYGNMMTGNTIKLMDLVAAGRWDEAQYYGVIVPSYIVGAGMCTLLNRLDLTWLGLGGPSDAAFADLQPPRRLRSPQEISVLRVVAIASVLLFLAGELVVVARGWSNNNIHNSGGTDDKDYSRWRLPFFACAFGLLNAATLAAIHIVTNAVTGHWITVGVGVADDWPTLLNSIIDRRDSGLTTSTLSSDSSATANDGGGRGGPEAQSSFSSSSSRSGGGSLKKWQSSMSVAASFIVAIVVTSLLYNECLRQVAHHPDRPLAVMFVHGPPMGVIFSILYAALLYWYTLPPPFLQGYSSQVDLVNF
jgi:hypothetical protein